jgi:hypothetical protein
MAGLAAVKVELDVEGLPAPPLPGDDAPGCAGGAGGDEFRPGEIKIEVTREIASRGVAVHAGAGAARGGCRRAGCQAGCARGPRRGVAPFAGAADL